jgi:carboxyl-terminal processing protease
MIGLLLLVIIGASGYSGYIIGRDGPVNSSIPSYIKNPKNIFAVDSSQGTPADMKIFWQAWNVIDQNYYGSKDSATRIDGAISGMVSSLGDPYTIYMPPTENKLFQANLQGSFGGIGAELTVVNGSLVVSSVLSGTPAESAGLKAEDVITAVDGKSVVGLSLDDAINEIRGNIGTQVKLSITRSGQKTPLVLSITRANITVKSVSMSSIGDHNQYAYIKVSQFGDDTVGLLQQALQTTNQDNKQGVIVDLRDNPGGYLTAAVSAIGMFLPAVINSNQPHLALRVAVEEKNNLGQETDDQATNSPIWPSKPVVVLVNGNSASASEIFSGAMKDYKRATLVGTKTFGKGSVQNLINLSNGGSIKVTIAKWFTPLGMGIDKKGIEPDVVVNLSSGAIPSTSDAQVSKALDILNSEVK